MSLFSLMYQDKEHITLSLPLISNDWCFIIARIKSFLIKWLVQESSNLNEYKLLGRFWWSFDGGWFRRPILPCRNHELRRVGMWGRIRSGRLRLRSLDCRLDREQHRVVLGNRDIREIFFFDCKTTIYSNKLIFFVTLFNCSHISINSHW